MVVLFVTVNRLAFYQLASRKVALLQICGKREPNLNPKYPNNVVFATTYKTVVQEVCKRFE